MIYLLGMQINLEEIGFFNNILDIWPLGFLFTLVAIAGFSQAINIIDGINGLSSSYCIVILILFSFSLLRLMI